MSIDKRVDVDETSRTLLRLSQLFTNYGLDLKANESIQQYYYYSILSEIIIHLRDLLQKLIFQKERIDFTDFVKVDKDNGVEDITDLVIYIRNGICHNDSDNRRTSKGNLFANNIYAGDGIDDIELIMGDFSIYVKRHLYKLYPMVLERFGLFQEFQENQHYIDAVKNAQSQCVFELPD